jgi:Helix-turn-helix domain
MSWEATAWASGVCRKAGDQLGPMARLVLIMLAERENRDTLHTFVSARTLAEDDCGCSVDSAKAWLRKLEALGYIARIQRERADGGNGTMLTILLRSEEHRAMARTMGWEGPSEAQDVEGRVKNSPGGPGENITRGPGEKTPHPGGKNTPCILEPRILTNTTPLSPTAAPAAPAAVERPALAVGGRALPDGYDRDEAGAKAFFDRWQPKTAADNPAVVMRFWARMSPADRKAALAGVEPFRRQVEREKRKLCTSVTYLRDRSWTVLDVLREARRDGSAVASFWIVKGTHAWEAWERFELRHGRRMVALPSKWERGEGKHMPSPWPPKQAREGPEAA